MILSDAFPWSQPSSQSTKTFLRSALKSIIFILVDFLFYAPIHLYICLFTRANSGREMTAGMTGCILSLPLRPITDRHICIICNKKKRRYCSRYNRKMLRGPFFLFKTPSAFDIFQSQFSNNTVCNYSALGVSIQQQIAQFFAGQTHNVRIN